MTKQLGLQFTDLLGELAALGQHERRPMASTFGQGSTEPISLLLCSVAELADRQVR